MQTRERNRTTIGVVNRTVISGRVTADETNRGLRIEKRKNLRRIACSTLLVASGLYLNLAPMPARADEDNDIHRERENNDRGIRAEIAALQAQVISLQSTVSGLQSQVKSLQNSNTSLQNQLTAAHDVLALAPFVSVDPNPEIGVIGPNITFIGANIHIVSGSGTTNDNGNPRGLGNLIIGYDEDPNKPLIADAGGGLPIMQAAGFPTPLKTGDRGGSHNLVIGSANRFTRSASGGLVVGERNTIKGTGASVSGGFNNTAGGPFASISAGVRNSATGQYASISGGGLNVAGDSSGNSVSGGFNNIASGPYASVFGGLDNTASDIFSIAP